MPSLEKAIEICKNEEEIFIIGGAQILKEAFEKGLVDEIRQTLVHADVEGDVQMSFPNEEEWEIVSVDAQ
ncbi:dihydrofolate reductase, partial [Lacticaseibacillus paracasei]